MFSAWHLPRGDGLSIRQSKLWHCVHWWYADTTKRGQTRQDWLTKIGNCFRMTPGKIKGNLKKKTSCKSRLHLLFTFWPKEELNCNQARRLRRWFSCSPQITGYTGYHSNDSWRWWTTSYRDIWEKKGRILSPSINLKIQKEKGLLLGTAVEQVKLVLTREWILANYLDSRKLFITHMDTSDFKLGAVISQDRKHMAYYTRKLNSA